jgi:hypothetical protein
MIPQAVHPCLKRHCFGLVTFSCRKCSLCSSTRHWQRVSPKVLHCSLCSCLSTTIGGLLLVVDRIFSDDWHFIDLPLIVNHGSSSSSICIPQSSPNAHNGEHCLGLVNWKTTKQSEKTMMRELIKTWVRNNKEYSEVQYTGNTQTIEMSIWPSLRGRDSKWTSHFMVVLIP